MSQAGQISQILHWIERLEDRLSDMPCAEHLVKVTELDERFRAMDAKLDRVCRLLGNGDGLTSRVQQNTHDIGLLLDWRKDERGRLEALESHRRMVRLTLWVSAIGWVVAAVLALLGYYL